ncbi:hypothetical protein GT030_10555 [Streptomyces sp. SID1328]|uniref:alpha/beta fold hydrolase n=1 Tax=Streptomyces sp. SID1328 TaxID=2690250 RepID=UPI0013689DE9|nr:alpha/beta hydrolase [Streptomyces sp. SID1328]MYV38312.1 hypothetical protein [Streptomyces sp. SID1328]MYV39305.1 hypothetical protein [Streptomyces sp. SID1328]
MVTRRFVGVGGVRLAYRVWGPPEGPPLVLAVRRQIDTPPAAWAAALGGITARTLILAGGPRSHVPRESVTELARLIPDARLRTIPVGHLIHREAPEAFTAVVTEFPGGPSAGR